MPEILRSSRLAAVAQVAFAALLVAAGSTSMARTANAFTSYEATVTCPIDGQPFTATMMGSNFQSGMRLDFKPIGALITPYPHPVCPGNGFVMYRNDFSETELDAIRPIVLSEEYRLLRAQNTDYFMIAYVKQRMGADSYDIGSTYLRASWEAERIAPDSVDRYRTLALQAFDTFLQSKAARTESWWLAAVLASELERLLGQFNAVALRSSVLPLAELSASYPDLKAVLDQIQMHAQQFNSAPVQLQVPPHADTTVGRALERMMQ